ncbi:MAG TPA: transposase [Terriglobales bacterium]|nr:transposase [Terriglobales bacterium]
MAWPHNGQYVCGNLDFAVHRRRADLSRFVVVGYVVMPEHIHLLLSEPEIGTPSTVMQVLKQRTARFLLPQNKRKDPRQTSLFGEVALRAGCPAPCVFCKGRVHGSITPPVFLPSFFNGSLQVILCNSPVPQYRFRPFGISPC